MRKHITLVLGLVFVLSVNIYFRSFPINFPQLKIQAKNIIEDRIRQRAIDRVDREFPAFDILAKQTLTDTLIGDYKKLNKAQVSNEIQKEYLKLKSQYQDDSGQTYIMELDCWHWARYVDNIVRYGWPGDEVVNGIQRDNLMLAPLGSDLGWNNFLFYLAAFLYKVFYIFKPVALFKFLFYLPLFFTAIFITALYLFCFYRWGNIASVISCLFVGLAPILLPRSCAGWFDMDVLNLLFPLLVIWTYTKSYGAGLLKERMLWVCFSSFWVGLFCFTWLGWFFIFLIVVLYEIYSLLNLISIYLQYKELKLALLKQHLISLLSFVCFSFAWIILFTGLAPITTLYNQLASMISLNNPLRPSLWPNVRYTVEELQRPDFLLIAQLVGGVNLLLLAMLAILFLFLYVLHRKKYTAEYQAIIIFIFWLSSMLLACFKGKRFAMFLLIPLGVSLGWCLNLVYGYIMSINSKKLRRPVFLSLAIVVAMLSTQFFDNAYKAARNTFPLIDDFWYKALIKIKESTAKGAIINSWWDFGDWFKVIANRRVIFDGQSQDSPQAYWMARVLLTDNEQEAVGILRMLNNGGNSAFEIINSYLKDDFKSIMFLKNMVLAKDKETARKNIYDTLAQPLAEKLVRLMFDTPAKAYFVVDPSMLPKAQSFSYIGNWDFVKYYLTQNIRNKTKKDTVDYIIKAGVSDKEAERLYQEAGLVSVFDNWVSRRSEYLSSLSSGKRKDSIALFDNGLVYNLKEGTVHLYSRKYSKYKIPESLFILKDNELKRISYADKELDFSVLAFQSKDGYRAILLDTPLATSLLTRLYLFDGLGLKHFKPFIEEKDGENYVKVFEIIWD